MSLEVKRPYAGGVVGHEHYFALRVYIEDTDFGGVVYHANYLRFLERARSDLLRSLGINQRVAIENGEGVYAVAEMHIKYCKPARLDDELLIVSQLDKVGAASCVIGQKILRGHEVVAHASVTAAFLSPEGRPKRQPLEWVKRFEAFKTNSA